MASSGLLTLAACVFLVGVLLKERGVEDAANLAGLLSAVLALLAPAIPLVFWWRRAPATTAMADQVSQARETLAGMVTGQWRHEARARSLGDPEPMPVHWLLTERAVMDHPRLIMAGQLSFTGRSDQIGSLATEFRRLRRRRLVILGAAGSGKTTLAVQLLLELLATRQTGEPIPVLLSLAGWDPTEHPRLQAWLTERLIEDYPSLRAFGPDVVRALAEQGNVLPILDGLDELPPPRRSEVIAALNASLTDADQLVLTSRTREYDTAVHEAHDVLTAAAVIEPEPLTPTQAADYLKHCLPPDPDPSWGEVLERLRAGTVGQLATVLATPLGLWLLRTVYITPRADPTALLNSDAVGEAATIQAHLFDQLIPAVLATRPATRNPPDMFRPRRTWNPSDVRNWLTYLAQHLHKTGTRDLLWWHLARHTFTNRVFGLTGGLAFGLVLGLPGGLIGGLTGGLPGRLTDGGLEFGLTFGLTVLLVGGLAVGLVAQGWLTDEPAYANMQLKNRTKMLANELAIGLAYGMVYGISGGLTYGLIYRVVGVRSLELAFVLAFGLVYGLAGGLVKWMGTPSRVGWANAPRSTHTAARTLTVLHISLVGLAGVLTIGLSATLKGEMVGVVVGGMVFALVRWVGTPSRVSWASAPRSIHTAARTRTVLQASLVKLAGVLTVGLLGALTIVLTVGLWIERTNVLAGTLAGVLAVGLTVGLLTLSSGAWLSYILASCRLAATGKLPLRLMDFLDDAYRLGLLRTTGPAYQFRHAEFHDHLIRADSSQLRQPQRLNSTYGFRGRRRRLG